jgi:hypothetical protein
LGAAGHRRRRFRERTYFGKREVASDTKYSPQKIEAERKEAESGCFPIR